MVSWLSDGLILLAGMAIGATSIGGVLVVPVLSALAGVPMPQAIAASSLAFLPTGLLGWRTARRCAPDDQSPWPLYAAALAGALAGALAVQAVPADAARIGLALLTAASGLYGLATAGASVTADRPMPSALPLSAVGLAVGFISAMSGTGGPVILLPLLMLWRAPTVPAVAAAMAIQLPVAVAATGTHLVVGHLPVMLGVQTGATLLAGAWVGQRIARRLPERVLRIGASLCLLAVAGWFGLSHRST